MNEIQTPPFDMARVTQLLQVLRRYREGKRSVEARLIASEQWWKLRNAELADREGHPKPGFRSRSGWLHNVITSKHADAMDACPEPNILPREATDKPEAERLSRLIPCILEQNRFERAWSDAWWSKLKFGTGVYCVAWDPEKLGGLGDVDIRRCDLLNLFWEPGVSDIQRSKYFFEVAFVDRDELRARYPELPIAQTHASLTAVLPYDDRVDMSEKVPVIHCYYHIGQALHYARFTPDAVLFATENDLGGLAQTGLYDHGQYPYIFDALFPVEGSPCGYGYVDLCKQPQTEIDLMKTAFVENTMNGARPRYFVRRGSGVNREQFLDLNDPLVEVEGTLDENAIAPIRHERLDGAYLAMLDRTIAELRETSGNTETSTGTVSSGVTAASAIAALQEASGKGSRDSAMSGYRAYADLVELVIELVRQFYDLPRQFRILGPDGSETFTAYSNRALKLQEAGGMYRLPVFDIRVVPQKRSAYTKMAMNDLALQLFSLGFFRADMADQALRCLTVMDFDGKDALRRVIEASQMPVGDGVLDVPSDGSGGSDGSGRQVAAPTARPGADRMERARDTARSAAIPKERRTL